MIAPAMKTRQDEPLRYVELARQGARIERSLAGNDLPRWSQLVDGAEHEWHVQAVLEFSIDDRGLIWAKGRYESRAGLLCTRCSEVLEHVFSGEISACIVDNESRADELAADCDVLIAEGGLVSLAEIVEDELLLAVPEQLCDTSECERLLPLSYPAAGAEAPTADDEKENPFEVLARLKNKPA